VRQRRGAALHDTSDWVAEEVPVALEYNGVSHAVMLASPADLEDFALGFSLTEDIVGSAADVRDIEVVEAPLGITVRLEVASACFARLKERRRSLAGRTGCGLCGTESLAQLHRPLPALPEVRVAAAAPGRAQRELRAWQTVQHLTGATHAAAWCGLDGGVRFVREDLGRHNALDKLVGALWRTRAGTADGFVCITSRASFEMIQKAALAGIGLVAAASAPTSLAIAAARAAGRALAGFVRGDDFVAYTLAERFSLAAVAPECDDDGR
jgi:FdhD protein